MKKNEYNNISIQLVPQEIIEKCDLNNGQSYGYIYVRFEKIMYGLVQAGIIAHKALKEHLKAYGYAPERITQTLCTHQERDIHFTLVVEKFGIKYRN